MQDLLRTSSDPECDLGSYDELGGLEDIVPAAILQDPKFHRNLRWKRRSFECILWWKTRHNARPAPIDAESVYFHRCVLSRGITQSITVRAKSEAAIIDAVRSKLLFIAGVLF